MCYKMHLEAAEIISRVPTPYQVEHFIKPMGRGEVLTTVAGGETSGKGNDWVPNSLAVSHVTRENGGYRLDNIRKSFVTSAGHATHYFFICRVGQDAPLDKATILFVESDKIDWEVLGEWDGIGMRGNNSSPMSFNGVVPEENRLGDENEAMGLFGTYMVPVLALTYAAAYFCIGSAAYEIALEEAARLYPSGSRRIDNPVNRRRMAEISAQIEAARALLHSAASAFDQGKVTSPLPFIQSKVTCSEAAIRATQDLMTMFGGTAFAGRLPFERYFRDARAGVVMGMANDQAYDNIASILFPDEK